MSAAPHRRPALIVFVVVAFVACLGLGWWQWGRYESGSGTGQNLGYALQWPLFAGFVVWAYLRFVRLEKDAREAESETSATEGAPATRSASAPRPKRPKPVAPREIPAGLLPERPRAVAEDDPQTAEYNRYLADLHASDLDQQIQDAGLRNHPERSAG
ncbi:transcriptional regulator [Nocardia sp. NBC_01503]|uniref:transcriptional regulator n=1 Tax=Nocardia sp. NBC_01503 TaxID=2975997 RepID=UPI002E7BA076|nr:transcriptional regulator [Nocardia sp. NBC_01503]WTL33585.1 transcriptional regulator [Nocardia sp. NBC_01503]